MKILKAVLLLLAIGIQSPAFGDQAVADDLAELRRMLVEMRQDYEHRIDDLEERLAQAERVAAVASRDAGEAFEIAEQSAIDQSSGSSAANTFNPALGAVLVGRWGYVDNGWAEIPGFQPGGEIGPGPSGFALGEAEINMKASIDPDFFGNLTLAVESEDGDTEIGLEEAWVQTTALPYGTTITGGRYFSGAGYLNKFHRHADDFVDRPLPYQAFLGGQYIVDGVQARWVVPAPLLVEFGAELDWGSGYPAAANEETSPGTVTLFTDVGGDIGVSNSWQFGLSWVSVDADEREGGEPGDAFSGDSDLGIADFVWKWAPAGNPALRNLKVQGEYFYRSEDGMFAGLDYDDDQTGWYLQGVWQFAQRWRVGYRHDVVDADNDPAFADTILADPGRSSKRDTLMLDLSPSEFSRLRLQYVRDEVLPQTDNQWFVQYIMSLGAHGTHEF